MKTRWLARSRWPGHRHARSVADSISTPARCAPAAGDQFNKIQTTYDTTFKTISGRVSSDPDYCTDKRSSQIKADLTRHLAGDYTPNLPKPKEVQCGGIFGGACDSGASDKKFESKEFYDELEKRKKN
jgi:hypothetical protein